MEHAYRRSGPSLIKYQRVAPSSESLAELGVVPQEWKISTYLHQLVRAHAKQRSLRSIFGHVNPNELVLRNMIIQLKANLCSETLSALAATLR